MKKINFFGRRNEFRAKRKVLTFQRFIEHIYSIKIKFLPIDIPVKIIFQIPKCENYKFHRKFRFEHNRKELYIVLVP